MWSQYVRTDCVYTMLFVYVFSKFWSRLRMLYTAFENITPMNSNTSSAAKIRIHENTSKGKSGPTMDPHSQCPKTRQTIHIYWHLHVHARSSFITDEWSESSLTRLTVWTAISDTMTVIWLKHSIIQVIITLKQYTSHNWTTLFRSL